MDWFKWLALAIPLVLQILGALWYASALKADTVQNAKDIQELKTLVVPRPEIQSDQQAIKDRLDSIDSQLTLILNKER